MLQSANENGQFAAVIELQECLRELQANEERPWCGTAPGSQPAVEFQRVINKLCSPFGLEVLKSVVELAAKPVHQLDLANLNQAPDSSQTWHVVKPDVQHITNGFQVEHRLHGLLLLVLSYCSLDKQHWEACAHQLKPILQAGKHIRQNQLAVRDFLAIASFTSRSSAGAQVVLDSCIVQHVLANVHAHEHPVPRMRARLLTTLCTISYSIGTATLLGSKPINPSASTYFADTAASAALAWSLPAQQRFAQELLQYDLAELAEAPVMDAVKELYPQDVQYIQFLCWHPSLAPLCDWLTAVPLAELLSSERAIACSYTAVDLLAVALCQNSTLRIQLLTTSSQPHGTQAGAAPGNAPPARAANTAAGAAAVTAYPPNGTSPLLEALLAHGLINHLRSCAAKRSSQTRAPAVELACALALSYRCRFRAALVADHFEHAGLGSAPGAASSSLNPSTADSAAGVGSTPVTNGHQPGGNGGSGCLSLQQRLDRLWLPLEPATAMTGAAAGSAAPAEGLLLGPSVTTERRPLLRVLLESSNMGSLLQEVSAAAAQGSAPLSATAAVSTKGHRSQLSPQQGQPL